MADDSYDSAKEPADAAAPSAKEDKAALFLRLKKLFRVDREFSTKWRLEAKEDFDFVAGEQWSVDDKEYLKSLMRPVITMNRTHTIVNAVSGQEMQNRQEVRYIPRQQGAALANELLTSAAHWFLDVADGQDEDSEAFLFDCICGMGWTDTTLEFDSDDAGAPDMAAINSLEMWWDRNARKNNLTDAERVWRVRKLPLSKAKEMFPDADESDLDAAWARIDDDDREPTDQDRDRLYHDDGDAEEADDDDQVTIVHCQYIVKVPAWNVLSPLTGQTQEMSDADYRTYKKRAAQLGLPVKAERKTVRKIRDCWLGGAVLQSNDALCQDKFRYQCITGYRDETKGTFYGLVRGMKDPQRWANKWLSQTLDIMNSQAKGGIIAERGVTDDARKFEKDWARPDKILWVDDGSLQGPQGSQRITPRPQGQFPQGFYQLMNFAFEMISQVPGVSPELLGQADQDQPASLEYQRRQAGLTILQPLFKNLKRYRKEQGHVILYILQNHMSDGRLIRVVGQDEAQYVPLMRQADVKYDIVVDDAPTSPNQKEMVWSMIGEKFWEMPTEMQMAFLPFSPFPSSVQDAIKKAGEQQSQSQTAQLQQALAQATAQLEAAKVGLTQAQTAKTAAEAQQVGADQQPGTDPMAEHAQEMARIQQEGELGAARVKQEGQISAVRAASEQTLDAQKANTEAALAHAKMVSDAAIKLQGVRLEAGIKRERAGADAMTSAFKARKAAEIAAKKPAPRAAT